MAEYLNQRVVEDGGRQKDGEMQNGIRLCRIVAVSFGLLCVLQVTLNISLRLADRERDQSSVINQTQPERRGQDDTCKDQLALERDQVRAERDQLEAERVQLNTERDQLKMERDQVKMERDQLNREREQLNRDRDHLNRERDHLNRERDQLGANCRPG
ncbi:ribonuclease Y-like isoform X1 [Osmerus eperlanus]|uniref:ribonuclease Y-like isoform X1 n=1 Tax=Osmerus eperlanus TaxID=29151 RepID=UPI002E10F3E7